MRRLAYSVTTTIERPIDVVFAFLSDLRSELAWNPNARSVEKLTDGPVGVGTRFRARWAGTRPVGVEVVRSEAPTTWTMRSRAMGMEVQATGRLEGTGESTWYTAEIELNPRGGASLVAPLVLRTMRRREARNLRLIKAALETRG